MPVKTSTLFFTQAEAVLHLTPRLCPSFDLRVFSTNPSARIQKNYVDMAAVCGCCAERMTMKNSFAAIPVQETCSFMQQHSHPVHVLRTTTTYEVTSSSFSQVAEMALLAPYFTNLFSRFGHIMKCIKISASSPQGNQPENVVPHPSLVFHLQMSLPHERSHCSVKDSKKRLDRFFNVEV